jgi:hypothetical protein
MYKLLNTPEDYTKKFSTCSLELSQTITECNHTVHSCILPNCMKINRLKSLIITLQQHSNFIRSYGAYLSNNQIYDIQVIYQLKLANSAIKEFEEMYSKLEEKNGTSCF